MGQASILQAVGLTLHEVMAGVVGNQPLRFDASVRIPDLGRFLEDPEHRAELAGSVTCAGLGGTMPIRDGVFELFVVDASSGLRQLRYSFHFSPSEGTSYYLYGHKDVHDDPGVDVLQDMTCLYTCVYRGENDTAPLYAQGELDFSIKDFPAL